MQAKIFFVIDYRSLHLFKKKQLESFPYLFSGSEGEESAVLFFKGSDKPFFSLRKEAPPKQYREVNLDLTHTQTVSRQFDFWKFH